MALLRRPLQIDGDFDASAKDNGQHGFLPRDTPGWYRKRFAIPAGWTSKAVWLRFHGVFHVSEIFLDGEPLEASAGSKSGYTSFTVKIPPHKVAHQQREHVLAIRVDASFGSGHWYVVCGMVHKPN